MVQGGWGGVLNQSLVGMQTLEANSPGLSPEMGTTSPSWHQVPPLFLLITRAAKAGGQVRFSTWGQSKSIMVSAAQLSPGPAWKWKLEDG